MSRRVTYIEIDLPVCPLTFGVAPCTATGVNCYNSLHTCGDRPAYFANRAGEVDTLRLCEPTLDLDRDIIAIPSLIGVAYTPSRIDLGQSIGVRSTLTVTINDHPAPDTGPGGDPYRTTRGGDPYNTGTFWGKLRARWPWLRGAALRWYTGTTTDSLLSMERRSFVIDRVEGPGSNGSVRIIAKDPLTLTDDKRAQAPGLSRGVLAADLGTGGVGTAFAVTPAGTGADYALSGFIAVGGEEIIEYTRAGDIFTVVLRGQRGTSTISHSAGDRVQWCLEYDGTTAADVIYDLMTVYGNVPAAYIDKDNWDAELANFAQFNFSALITEPTNVVDLINEVLQQAGVSIWFDELAETIRFQVLRRTTGNTVYNDDVMLAGSFQQIEQPEKRVSEVWVYYDQISPLENLTERTNYRIARLRTSTESFENHGTPAIKQIFSRWMPAAAGTAVERLQEFILARFGEPPKLFQFKLLRDSGIPAPVLGQAVQVNSYFNQLPDGTKKTSLCQIIQLQATESTWLVTAEEIQTSDVDAPPLIAGVYIIPIDVNRTDGVNIKTEYDSWYVNPPVSGDTVACIVRGGVRVGNTRNDLPALRTGTGWPAGVTVQLLVSPNAYIVGKGGNAGRQVQRRLFPNVGTILPQDGGLAIWVESDLEIDNQGVIGGGGGGGGGAATIIYRFQGIFAAVLKYIHFTTTGGGGAGFPGGDGLPAVFDTDCCYTLFGESSGIGGSLETGGASGLPFSGSTEGRSASVSSGAGGNLGAAGAGAASSSTGVDSDTAQDSSQTGGAAGAAIVETTGTVTYTTRGDIRGAAPA